MQMNLLPVPTGKDKARSYEGDYMKRGREAEEIVLSFLKKRPDVIGVTDWRNLRAVQEADIDCAIKTVDGRITLAEIKSDSYLGRTPNVLFEVLRINHTCDPIASVTLGWSGRTPATYILYYAASIRKLYCFETSKLRMAFQKYTREARANMKISIIETDAIKTTVNILVPISYCQGAYAIYEIHTEQDNQDFDDEYAPPF